MINVKRFTELYGEIYKDLYRYALCMMKHQQDAEDAVSETVVRAYENRKQLRKEEAFKGWIFSILTNVCRSKWKEKSRMEQELREDHPAEMKDLCAREDIRKALDILSDEEREIVALSVYGGYTSKEIGELLKLNSVTVRSKRKRAYKKMSYLLKV